MTASGAQANLQTLHIVKEVFIEASPEVVFQTILEPQEPLKPMNLKLEPWPGGRWYRDTGNDTGHLWGHVQVIKPPRVLEIVGPLMMSHPVASHIQYRLLEQDGGTLLKFTHHAFGIFDADHHKGLNQGWGEMMDHIRVSAMAK